MAWYIPQELMNNNPMPRPKVLEKIKKYGYTPLDINFEYKNQETKIPCYDSEGYIVNVAYIRLGIVKNFLRFCTKSNMENFVYNANVLGKKIGNKSTVLNVFKIGVNEFRKHERLMVGCQCECGDYFEIDWASWRVGYKHECNKCSSSYSNLEVITRKFLDNEHIASIAQYKFEDCVNKVPLPFDFYCPIQNLCIEVDGEQHEKESSLYVDSFEENKLRDKIKTKYCKDNNIKLLRISYREILNGKYKERILKAIY